MEKIILMGGGAHCKVIIDTILLEKRYKIEGIIDVRGKRGEKVLGVPVIGNDGDLKYYFKKGIKNCFIGLGSIGYPQARMRLFNLAEKIGFKFPNVVHRSSIISKFVKLGCGNFIGAGVIINPGTNIGNNCIINTGTVIEHDCNINDFVHVASGAILSGRVTIGRCSHIGILSLVIQNIGIGENSIIGAGSVVVKDIGNNVVAFGNPCKKIRDNE